MAESSDDGSPSEADSTVENVPETGAEGTEERAAGTATPTAEDRSDGGPQSENASAEDGGAGESEGDTAGHVAEEPNRMSDSEPNGSASSVVEETEGEPDAATGTADSAEPTFEGERPGENGSSPLSPEEEEVMRRAMERSEDSAVDESVSSLAGRAKPDLAERQALVAVAGAMAAGVVSAVIGVLLDLTVSDVKVVLALGGLLLLIIGVFVLFRAMLLAAERNDEPVRSALTHPLFMFLFVVLAAATALFIGLLRRMY